MPEVVWFQHAKAGLRNTMHETASIGFGKLSYLHN